MDGLGGSFTGEIGGVAGYAEMTAVKFAHSREDQARLRILFHLQRKKISRTVPLLRWKLREFTERVCVSYIANATISAAQNLAE